MNTTPIHMTFQHGDISKEAEITPEKLSSYLVDMHAQLGTPLDRLMADKALILGGEKVTYRNRGRKISFQC
jgi:hypothetical protein